MTLWASFEEAAQRHARRPVLADSVGMDYAELATSLRGRAAFLRARGLRPGDRIAIFAPNCLEFLELHLVAAALGVILLPLNLRLSSRELRAILEDARPRWLVRGVEAREVLDEACEGLDFLEGRVDLGGLARQELAWSEVRAEAEGFEPAPVPAEAIAQLYYTSGTTGRAKGVPLSHGNVQSHAQAAQREFGLNPADVWGHFAPMFHLADAWATFAVTFAGGRHAFLPSFGAQAAFEVLERDRVTITNLVPTMLNLMVHEPGGARRDCSSLRLVLSGGAPIAPELVLRVERLFGCAYAQTYGLTETCPYLTVSLPTDEVRALSEQEQARYRARTGRAFGGIELRVVDVEGREVAADDRTVGEIQARGPWVFDGYWGRPEETAAAFTDGWFRTGDLAVIDARGSINIVDRKKDVILSGGETVYSTEVENALYTHDLVREAAVFGLPDELWGEVVTAAVVRQPGEHGGVLEADALLGHCRLYLAGYKLPRRVKFLEELPKSGSGKIQKRLLRERLNELGSEEFDFVHGEASS